MKYLCGKCIHFDVCYVPRTKGCVEICGHFKEEPKEPMTEQEYIQTCNTEQLAEYLADKFNDVVDFVLHEVDENAEDIEPDDYWYRQDVIVEWLKQPHTPKE